MIVLDEDPAQRRALSQQPGWATATALLAIGLALAGYGALALLGGANGGPNGGTVAAIIGVVLTGCGVKATGVMLARRRTGTTPAMLGARPG